MFSFESASIEFKKPKNLLLFSNDQEYDSQMTMSLVNNVLTETSALLTPTTPNYMPNSFHQNDFTETFNKTLDVPSYTTYSSELSDFYSFVETPNSIQSATPHTHTKDDIFKFEPEHIELFQQSDYFEGNSTIDLDAEYMNYDEINCQSKNNSHCSSPNIDPWLCLNLQSSNSPKPDNNLSAQMLPSMNTVFGNQFNSTPILSDDHYSVQERSSLDQSEEHFNINLDEKPKREQKDMWLPIIKEEFNLSPNIVEHKDNGHASTCNKDENGTQIVQQCLWKDCHLEFDTQALLVEHIEKRHVETRKGEEFSCHWHECTRRQKPFNARYKLLIHMRVHSGEKPNKCQVSSNFILV